MESQGQAILSEDNQEAENEEEEPIEITEDEENIEEIKKPKFAQNFNAWDGLVNHFQKYFKQEENQEEIVISKGEFSLEATKYLENKINEFKKLKKLMESANLKPQTLPIISNIISESLKKKITIEQLDPTTEKSIILKRKHTPENDETLKLRKKILSEMEKLGEFKHTNLEESDDFLSEFLPLKRSGPQDFAVPKPVKKTKTEVSQKQDKFNPFSDAPKFHKSFEGEKEKTLLGGEIHNLARIEKMVFCVVKNSENQKRIYIPIMDVLEKATNEEFEILLNLKCTTEALTDQKTENDIYLVDFLRDMFPEKERNDFILQSDTFISMLGKSQKKLLNMNEIEESKDQKEKIYQSLRKFAKRKPVVGQGRGKWKKDEKKK